jgi:toxin CcdB
MARYDIFARPEGDGYYLDCQADLLSHLNTRFVVPLLMPDIAPKPAGRLNPQFLVNGDPFVMVTQFAAAIPLRDLSDFAGSLADHDMAIMGAIDMLTSGY